MKCRVKVTPAIKSRIVKLRNKDKKYFEICQSENVSSSVVKRVLRENKLTKKIANVDDKIEYETKYGKGSWNHRLKDSMIRAYGGKCQCCGETIREFLTIDHMTRESRRSHHSMMSGRKKCGNALYFYLKKHGFPKRGVRLLCMNCNLATSWNRICPHKRVG